MMEIKNLKNKSRTYMKDSLRKEYILASSDTMFSKLCSKLKCSEEILMKYTTRLEDTTEELKNCSGCKGLNNCKNRNIGHVYYPIVYKDIIDFEFKPCKYYKKDKTKNKTTFFETPKVLRNANLSDIHNEKERVKILEYIKTFLKKKVSNEEVKGLYLSGSFGSGKSYIISALLNELSMKGYSTVNVYYPTLLQKLKMSMDDGSYDTILDEICVCDVLLLDDIGAENNTAWARDEILGTIMQYRMDNELTTFFTSNYTIEELEEHLETTKGSKDIVKARRIIERIKYLTIEEKLVSKDKRN